MGRPSSNQSDTPRAAATSSSSTAPTTSSHQLAGCPRDSRSSPVRRATSRRKSRYAHSKDTSPTHANRTTTKNGAARPPTRSRQEGGPTPPTPGAGRPATRAHHREVSPPPGSTQLTGSQYSDRSQWLQTSLALERGTPHLVSVPDARAVARWTARSASGSRDAGSARSKTATRWVQCSTSFGPDEALPKARTPAHGPICAAITSDATPPSRDALPTLSEGPATRSVNRG
jgi:hypothetical protein